MNPNKIRGIALIVMGIALGSFYFSGARGVVWLAIGIVFVLLGVTRLRIAQRP